MLRQATLRLRASARSDCSEHLAAGIARLARSEHDVEGANSAGWPGRPSVRSEELVKQDHVVVADLRAQ